MSEREEVNLDAIIGEFQHNFYDAARMIAALRSQLAALQEDFANQPKWEGLCYEAIERAETAERERDEARRERDQARGDVNRWIQAALAATMPDEFGLAFDPTNPDGWAFSRRSTMEKLLHRAERAERASDAWRKLYLRAVNEANGLTNYVEERPELTRAERELEKIQQDARAIDTQEPIS